MGVACVNPLHKNISPTATQLQPMRARRRLSLSGAARDREEVTERVHPRAEHNTDMVIGSAKSTTLTIRASQRARSTVADNDRCGLFITRLHANTSEAELNEYVRNIAGCRVRTFSGDKLDLVQRR